MSENNTDYEMPTFIVAIWLAFCLACLGIVGCTYFAIRHELNGADKIIEAVRNK